MTEERLILETERLEIRRLDISDAAFMLRLMNEPSYIEYIGDRGIDNLEAAITYLEKSMLSSYREHGFGLYFLWSKKEQRALGICGFVKRAYLSDPDLGFALLKDAEGQGYASESCQAVLAYAKTTLGFPKVLAISSLHNERSMNLCKNLGFVLEDSFDLRGERLNRYVLTL
ncbi:MAG: GNAT family N-acetyltransferase [Planctomycetota bacterium]|nr:GNAT family N-acetyltransferase [Planctomycetota bacterium]